MGSCFVFRNEPSLFSVFFFQVMKIKICQCWQTFTRDTHPSEACKETEDPTRENVEIVLKWFVHHHQVTAKKDEVPCACAGRKIHQTNKWVAWTLAPPPPSPAATNPQHFFQKICNEQPTLKQTFFCCWICKKFKWLKSSVFLRFSVARNRPKSPDFSTRFKYVAKKYRNPIYIYIYSYLACN